MVSRRQIGPSVKCVCNGVSKQVGISPSRDSGFNFHTGLCSRNVRTQLYFQILYRIQYITSPIVLSHKTMYSTSSLLWLDMMNTLLQSLPSTFALLHASILIKPHPVRITVKWNEKTIHLWYIGIPPRPRFTTHLHVGFCHLPALGVWRHPLTFFALFRPSLSVPGLTSPYFVFLCGNLLRLLPS